MSEQGIKILSQSLGSVMFNFASIKNFRALSSTGLEQSRDELYDEQLTAVLQLLRSPDGDKYLIKEKLLEKFTPAGFAQFVADNRLKKAQASIDAASIIFAHTILDSVLFQLCEVTTIIDPSRWDDEIKDRKISFSEIKDSNPEQIRLHLLKKKLAEIERSSLLEKCDILYRRCQVTSVIEHEKYQYSRDKLAVFDTIRHDVVHGRLAPDKGIDNIEELLSYAENTGVHFVLMVSNGYDTKMDPNYIVSNI
ncbi:hypothetical protein [Dendrosporobacter sp. 1207_IL3150]|uniref:hypothetical protein n=1 Tax=Dendrosporobacter sp. 1207_IL3150 TaxID=3084054 RepID=UPI002FDA7184